MEALVDDAILKGKKNATPVNGNPQLAKNLMKDISDIINYDIDNDQSFGGGQVKKSHVITTKDFIDAKKKFPSATDLMNNPLRDSYSGLEGETDLPVRSQKDLRKLTAKDLSRSINDNLDIQAANPGKSKSKSKTDVSKSSAGKLVNDTLRKSNGGIAEEVSFTKKALNVTAKELQSIQKGIVAEGATKSNLSKSKSKSNRSVGAQLNEPLKASTNDLSDKLDYVEKLPPKPTDLNQIYSAKESHRQKHDHERI